jgi:hypothetical protein
MIQRFKKPVSSCCPPNGRRPFRRLLHVLVAVTGIAAACTTMNPDYQPGMDAGVPGRETAAEVGPQPMDGPPGESASMSADVRVVDGPDIMDAGNGADAGADTTAGTDTNAGVDTSAGLAKLLGAWRFDEGPPSATAADSSGNGAVAKLVNMNATTAWVPGRKGGKALEFNPTSAVPEPSVQVALVPALQGLKRFTVAAWIYRTETSKPMQQGIFSQQYGEASSEVFNLCLVNNEAVLYMNGPGAGIKKDVRGGALPVGAWIHLAASFDGAAIRLYRNGAPVGVTEYPYALPASSKPLVIGSNINNSSQQPFVGYIDDVLIYDAALSDAAIAELARP